MTQETALTKTVEQQVTTRFGSLFRNADKKAVEIEKAKVLVLAGFDPVFHLTIYEDSLWVTKPGYNWWLRRRDHHPNARISSEPIEGQARRAGYGLKEDEIGVIASIYLPGQSEPVAKGFGKASTRPYQYERPPDNATPAQKAAARQHPDRRRNPIEAVHPYDMAEIRAERKAVFKLVPVGGAPLLGMNTEDSYASTTPAATGPIIDAEARVVPEAAGQEAPGPADVLARFEVLSMAQTPEHVWQARIRTANGDEAQVLVPDAEDAGKLVPGGWYTARYRKHEGEAATTITGVETVNPPRNARR